MAIIDRVKFDGLRNRDWIIYKHPAEDLVLGTQLIVGEGQVAIFVKSGRVCDLFTAGTYVGLREHTHFVWRVYEQSGTYFLDPWILMHEMWAQRDRVSR